MVCWMTGWIWMDGWLDLYGQVDDWMNAWMDGWKDVSLLTTRVSILHDTGTLPAVPLRVLKCMPIYLQ